VRNIVQLKKHSNEIAIAKTDSATKKGRRKNLLDSFPVF
jgi:hypothetical protein